jgi:hypothetical protein
MVSKNFIMVVKPVASMTFLRRILLYVILYVLYNDCRNIDSQFTPVEQTLDSQFHNQKNISNTLFTF